jgi:hypothetical protein
VALTAIQIRQAWRALLDGDATLGQTFTKDDLAAAASAVDAWADTNAASYNTALPQPFKGGASAAQKNLLLAYVCMKRAGVI